MFNTAFVNNNIHILLPYMNIHATFVINSKKAILIGTLNVDINSKTDVYNLLSEYYNKHNYLDNSTAFFC